jgi:hypothetical protein
MPTGSSPAIAARRWSPPWKAALKRLKTDRIDIYWAHHPDGVTPAEELVRGFEDLARAGKILYAGLSWRIVMRIALAVLSAVVLLVTGAHAQGLVGDRISEGKRGKIEIYACGTAGHDVRDKDLLDKLCSYVKDDGPRLCGRIKEILPDGLAELKAKGKKPEDQLRQAMLCVARSKDQEWPWRWGLQARRR